MIEYLLHVCHLPIISNRRLLRQNFSKAILSMNYVEISITIMYKEYQESLILLTTDKKEGIKFMLFVCILKDVLILLI